MGGFVMRRFAVVLAGAGRLDGNNIHEVVLLLAELTRQGASYECFAPDMLQHEVINHYNSQPQYEQRNVLYEATRINGGETRPLSELNPSNFDGLCFPGGYGVAKNLCTFALAGKNYTVLPEVEQLIKTFHTAQKPIVALCIAPMLIAKVLPHVTLTLGQACEAGAVAAQVGAKVELTQEGEVCVDTVNHLFTTPCYMLNSDIAGVWRGIAALVEKVLASLK